MNGKMNTNVYCTREMAVCRFQPDFATGGNKQNANVACNETVSLLLSHVCEMFFTDSRAGCSQVDADCLDASRAHCISHVFSPGLSTQNQQGKQIERERGRGPWSRNLKPAASRLMVHTSSHEVDEFPCNTSF
jgi:hypothetical protein